MRPTSNKGMSKAKVSPTLSRKEVMKRHFIKRLNERYGFKLTRSIETYGVVNNRFVRSLADGEPRLVLKIDNTHFKFFFSLEGQEILVTYHTKTGMLITALPKCSRVGCQKPACLWHNGKPINYVFTAQGGIHICQTKSKVKE